MPVSGFAFSPVLYAACVSPLEDARLYDAAYAAASPARRQKADRFRFAEDRRLSLCAELLLRCALRDAGIQEFTMDFDYGAQEKPYFKNGGIYFNFSHSKEYAACAVAGCEVGCDVEKVAPVNLKVADRFFFRKEYTDIMAQPTPEAKCERFFRYWTLKESFMKATGLGMKLPLNAFQIVLDTEISVIQTVDHRTYRFTEFEDIPGYRCALCTAGGGETPTFRMIDLTEILSLR